MEFYCRNSLFPVLSAHYFIVTVNSQSQKSLFFSLAIVSPSDQLLIKKPENFVNECGFDRTGKSRDTRASIQRGYDCSASICNVLVQSSRSRYFFFLVSLIGHTFYFHKAILSKFHRQLNCKIQLYRSGYESD